MTAPRVVIARCPTTAWGRTVWRAECDCLPWVAFVDTWADAMNATTSHIARSTGDGHTHGCDTCHERNLGRTTP